MIRILVVDDEPHILALVTRALHADGHETVVAEDGQAALDRALEGDIDLVILDVGLPDLDGFQVLEQLRGQGVRVPVIMLTARSSVTDTVAGLQGGADDYMAKPFSFEELLARIRLRLRAEGGAEVTVLSHGAVSLDLRTRRATSGTKDVELSAREFGLLEAFLRNPGQVLSREQLLNRVWGYDFDPGSNVVDVYVRYLRTKLGAEHIETVRGMGYRLVE